MERTAPVSLTVNTYRRDGYILAKRDPGRAPKVLMTLLP